MLKATNMNLPEALVEKAKAYASRNNTTVTAIVREHLESLTDPNGDLSGEDPLLAYSKGLLSRRETIRRLGLRDSADLLVALGDADLPMPLPSQQEIDREAAAFVALWRMG